MTEPFLYFFIPGLPLHVVYTWILMIVLVGVALLVRGSLQLVPAGGQNFFEAFFGGMLDFIDDVMGHRGRAYFPLLATLGLYIFRANLMALKQLHVDSIIALNTVGTVDSAHKLGQLAVPHQLIDYTYGRDHSIYYADSATLEHIDFTEPFDAGLRSTLLQAAADVEAECHDGGVYAVTQGPRLETAAEVNRLERDGAQYVGMTAMPEASLARELGIAYACLSLIVNYAAGRGELAIHEDIEASTANARAQAMQVLRRFFQTRG